MSGLRGVVLQNVGVGIFEAFRVIESEDEVVAGSKRVDNKLSRPGSSCLAADSNN